MVTFTESNFPAISWATSWVNAGIVRKKMSNSIHQGQDLLTCCNHFHLRSHSPWYVHPLFWDLLVFTPKKKIGMKAMDWIFEEKFLEKFTCTSCSSLVEATTRSWLIRFLSTVRFRAIFLVPFLWLASSVGSPRSHRKVRLWDTLPRDRRGRTEPPASTPTKWDASDACTAPPASRKSSSHSTRDAGKLRPLPFDEIWSCWFACSWL